MGDTAARQNEDVVARLLQPELSRWPTSMQAAYNTGAVRKLAADAQLLSKLVLSLPSTITKWSADLASS
jgi:hypothetical protein